MRRMLPLVAVLALTACSGGEAAEVEPVPTVTETVTVQAPDPLDALGVELCDAIRSGDMGEYLDAVRAIQAELGTTDEASVREALIDTHCPEYAD